MKEVWLIRHGESEANAGLASSDPALTPLTEKGYQQAIRVSTIIPAIPSLIVFSPYLRTRQTAELTQQLFPRVECQEWNIQEFSFLSRALCQNTTRAERRPMVKEYWKRNDPLYVHGEGAESFADFQRRVHDTYQRIAATGIERRLILIFGHGQFMRLLLLTLLSKSFDPTAEQMQRFALFDKAYEIPNCGIHKMIFHDQEPLISGLILDHLQD